jgi:regulator of RNase E activity RraA
MRVLTLALLIGLSLFAQRPFDTPLPADHAIPKQALTNREGYSPLYEVLKRERTAVSDEQLQQLGKYQLENLWGSMGEYRETNYVRGFLTTQPGKRLVGRALTMRFLPTRPDLEEASRTLATEANRDRRYYIRAGEEAHENDVVVVDLGGAEGTNFFGDITALGIAMRGAAGVLIDGGTRDLAELRGPEFKDFPVLARFFDIHGATWVGADWNMPIRVGGATVVPGDIVVADEGGVLFIPPQIVPQVLEQSAAREARENFERGVVRSKKYLIRDVYPLHPKLEEQLKRQMEKK